MPDLSKNLSTEEFARLIVDILSELKIEYMLGGSVALWAWGEVRTTMDVDLVAHLPLQKTDLLEAELWKNQMAVPAEIMRDLILDTRSDLPINAIHPFSGNKAEIFPLRKNDEFRALALDRRLLVSLREPLGQVYVHSPEDLILYKLYYYSISRQTKHNRDIGSILSSGHKLDMHYIQTWASRKGLLNIWREFLSNE